MDVVDGADCRAESFGSGGCHGLAFKRALEDRLGGDLYDVDGYQQYFVGSLCADRRIAAAGCARARARLGAVFGASLCRVRISPASSTRFGPVVHASRADDDGVVGSRVVRR